MPVTQLQVGKTYSFDTYAPEVLGTRIINAKCLAILNAENANIGLTDHVLGGGVGEVVDGGEPGAGVDPSLILGLVFCGAKVKQYF